MGLAEVWRTVGGRSAVQGIGSRRDRRGCGDRRKERIEKERRRDEEKRKDKTMILELQFPGRVGGDPSKLKVAGR